jgi:hypothetical protein
MSNKFLQLLQHIRVQIINVNGQAGRNGLADPCGGKCRIDAEFVHFVDENHDVVTQEFTERLVSHRGVRPTSEILTELSFQHAEDGFRV